MKIVEINGRWTCTECGYEWSAMLGDNEIPEKCSCEGDMDIQEKIKRNIYSYLKKRNKSLDGLFFKNPENFFKVHDHLEPYHDNIKLVVLHEGSDVSKFFNWAYRCNDEIERMKKVLSKIDCKISQYESWYSVIYRERG